jgi:energy-coupling factor transporter ATP-binding protein EcfA2
LMETNTATFDRRQAYRPFIERLNPASGKVDSNDLIVLPEHDPRDADQPPIHVAFTNTAELNRGSQLALVGGIGSGKTTQLRLTYNLLKRHSDAVNVLVDLAEITDLDALNPGAILVAIGLEVFKRLRKSDRQAGPAKTAHQKLLLLARGETKWVEPYEVDDSNDGQYDAPDLVPIQTPGLLKPRFPPVHRSVEEAHDLLSQIALPLLASDAQITVLMDGLDRLYTPESFRRFAEQDFRALRDLKISVIVAAPLLMWFDKGRFLQDYFDEVKHIPAAVSDPDKSDFLKRILLRRGALELMDETEISEIARFSGGVLRDLITLARTSAEAAYRDDDDHIRAAHVQLAIRQLGKRYLVGLGKTQRKRLQRLVENDEFSIDDPAARALLVNRQVLEYLTDGRELFGVHPALMKVMKESD